MKTLPQRQAQPPIGNYLEGEQSSDIRHEYLAGQVVARRGLLARTRSSPDPCMLHCYLRHAAKAASYSWPI